MPTYEYACTSCGHHLEIFQSFSEAPLATCPNCGGDLRKVFGSIGIVLKGSGFYRNDSRAAANGKAGTKSSSDPTDTKEKDKKGGERKEAATSAGDSTAAGSTPTSPAPASSSPGSSPSRSPGSSTAAAS